MEFLYLILSIILISGFDFIGKKMITLFHLDEIIKSISIPIGLNALAGISLFVFIMFPLFFIGFFNSKIFISISSFLLILGLLNFYSNFFQIANYIKKEIALIKFNKFTNNLILFFILLYFLLSISPVTSGDSLAYHMTAAKHIFETGALPSDFLNSNNSLVGSGELLNAFAISINAYQFTSLINFIGLISILSIFKKKTLDLNLKIELKNFIYLCVLSCPVIIFLISSSKSQLYATALIFISYSILFNCIIIKQSKNFLHKSILLSTFFCIVAVQTKISFSLSFFLIICSFLFFFKNKIISSKAIFIFISFILIGLFPQPLWKQYIYDYPFYHFFFNPFPLNIPGYLDVYINSKIYLADKFPLSIFVPLSLGDLTGFIGIGSFLLFFLLKYKFDNKFFFLIIIFLFIFIFSLVGQKTPRFYLEIYFLIILIFTLIINKVYKNKIFKFFKNILFIQSLVILGILLYGVFSLFPGIINQNLNKLILSKYASGYNLYSWVNTVLPKNSNIIVNHRSTYFLNKDHVYFEMAYHLNNNDNDVFKNYYLNLIKEKKPNFILFYGENLNYKFNLFDFSQCTNGIFRKKERVGFNETRNPFNNNLRTYNAYIYHFDYLKLPGCVKIK